jgi:hypothetical protein
MTKYEKKYIDGCRVRIDSKVASYQALAQKVTGGGTAALNSFEPDFFAALLLSMDSYFTHRMRGLAKKDGNPLNEVRILCNSMMLNKGIVLAIALQK